MSDSTAVWPDESDTSKQSGLSPIGFVRIACKILHQGVRYEERGNRPNPHAVRERTRRLTRALRHLGYQVQLTPLTSGGIA